MGFGRTRISRLTPILLVIYFLEVGLFLLVVPWSQFWERNFFSSLLPWLTPIVGSAYTRGAISGVGVVMLAAAIAELVYGLSSARRRASQWDTAAGRSAGPRQVDPT
jgi:hypothetical protein